MKSRFFNLSLKCCAFILALVLIVSCVPIVALAMDEDTSEAEHKHQIGTSFNEGVYTVTVDVDQIFEMIDSGNMSRDTLKELVPQEVTDALATEGSAYDKAVALLIAYINIATDDDPERIYEIFPVDMTIEYLTQEPDPLLERVISKGEFLRFIDLVMILSDMDRAGELSTVIDINGATDIMLKSQMIDEMAMMDMLKDLEKNDPETYNVLLDEAAGGDSLYDAILNMDADRLVEILGFTRIINIIGQDKLLDNHDIVNLIDYAELMHVFIRHGYFNTMSKGVFNLIDKAALLEIIPAYLINFSESVSVNGKEIYSVYDAKIDVDLLSQIIAESMPTFDKLAADPENAFSFIVDWRLNEKNIDSSTTKNHYTFELEVKVTGNTERLSDIFHKLASYIHVVNEGNRTDISLRVPAKMAALYLKAINTDKLPTELKAKILGYSDMEITEDNVQAIISDFTVDEILSIIESVDFTRATDAVEKMLELYSDPYDRALSMAKRAVTAMTYDKLSALADRIGVAKIESGLENNEQKILELRSKILGKIDTMTDEALLEAIENGTFGEYSTLFADYVRSNADKLNLIRDYLSKAINRAFEYAPSNIVGQKLSDYYNGNGQFGPIAASFGFDIAQKLEQMLASKLPEETVRYAMNFLTNTEITREVSLQLTVDDIYEVKFVNSDGDVVFVTYLPTGADLSVIYGLPELADYDNKWTYDGETEALIMPEHDVRLTVLIPEHVHDMIHIKTVYPTCTEGGYELWRCECQFEEKRNVVGPLGHDVAEHWSIATYPTKRSTGKAVKVCMREECGSICEETILPTLPDQTDYFYIVTLNKDGYCETWTVTYEFLVGTDKFTYEISANANHTWSEWTVIEAPTIHDDGLEERICGSCQKRETRTVLQMNASWKDMADATTGVIVSGIFADDIDHRLVVDDSVDYNASAWAGASGIENIDRIKLMDISIANLSTDHYDYVSGLVVTIPIPAEYKNRDLVVYHKLHDGTIEKFANHDDALDENHRLSIVEIPAISGGTIPAIRFTVYSFSEFLIGMEHVHEYGRWEVKKNPTLTAGGTLKRECTIGNEVHVEELSIPALNDVDYSYVLTPGSDCNHGGMEYYTYTTPNGEELTFSIALDAPGHAWSEWVDVTVPTATSNGLLKRVCSRCGNEETKVLYALVATNKDKYTDYVELSAPDCTEKGREKYIYTIDGQTFTYEVETNALGHVFGAWVKTTDPTLTSTGLLTRTCERHGCGETEEHILPALNKTDYTHAITLAPSCDTTGTDTYTYTIDGQVFTYEVTVDELGHSFGEWVKTTNPTLTLTGLLTRTCGRQDCGETEEHILPALNKTDYTHAVTLAPSCDTTGTDTYTYTIDGQTFTYNVTTSALGHSFGEWVKTTNPTLTSTGLLTKTCERHNCDETREHVLPILNKTDYTYTHENPTCTEKGADKYVYAYEGQSFTFEIVIDEIGHSFGEWTVTVYPTKDTTGTLTRSCANDSAHTETHTLPVLPDKESGDGYVFSCQLPTCTVPGHEKYVYEHDGVSFEFTVNLAATGHQYGQWTVTVEPTKDETGKLTKVCENDPTHVITYTLPKLDDLLYSYTLVSAATCTETGTAKYVYRYDGQVFEFTVVLDALGHDFSKWTVVTAPTLESEGTLQRACANDPSHKETHTIPVLNAEDYTYVVVTAPLCESNGVAKYSYTFGEKVFEFTVDLSAIGHEYTDWEVSVAPTLTTGGELTRTCVNNPEHKQTLTIPAFGEGGSDYTYKVTKEPTESEPGSAKYTYTVDGVTLEFVVEIPATGETETDSDHVPGSDTDSSWWIVIVIILVIVLIAAALFIIWWFFIKNNNDKNPPNEPVPVVQEQQEPVKRRECVPNPIKPTVMKASGVKSFINVGKLDVAFSDGDTVSLATLKEKGLIPMNEKKFKVLADGTLNKALVVEANEFSPQAKEKILAAGGQVIRVTNNN